MTKFIKLLPIGLVCLYFAFMTLLILANPAQVWINSIFDDAYYYLGIARNIGLGNGSMFAAPLETNVYQPLWLVILSAASFVVGGDRTALVLATHLLAALSVLCFIMLSRHNQGVAWPAALVVLMFPFVFLLGMETVLIFPLALMYFRTSGWVRGLLASLIFLSRLDTVGLILGRIVYEFVRYRKVDWRELVVLGLCASAYVALNVTLFGTAVPVSGMAKSVGAELFSNVVVIKQFLIAGAAPVLAAILLAVSAVTARRYQYEAEVFSGLFAIACSIAYYFSFSGYGLWGWYYWPIAWVFYWALLSLKIQTPPVFKKLAIASIVFAVSMGLTDNLMATGVSVRSAIAQDAPEDSWAISNEILAEKIRSSDLPSTTFAMGDRAGSFGYFLGDEHKLIQTEGLVASRGYLEALKADNGLQFLEAHGVEYYVVNKDDFWMWDGGYVIADPMMPLSARRGVMLMCYPHSALAPELDIERRGLRVFRFDQRVDCPEDVVRTFEARKKIYGGIHYKKPVD